MESYNELQSSLSEVEKMLFQHKLQETEKVHAYMYVHEVKSISKLYLSINIDSEDTVHLHSCSLSLSVLKISTGQVLIFPTLLLKLELLSAWSCSRPC